MAFSQEEFSKYFNIFNNDILNYLGHNEYTKRFNNICTYLIEGNKKIYRECQDTLFLYIVFSYGISNNIPYLYNVFEGARIIPAIFNLCKQWKNIYNITNYNDKIKLLCNENSDTDSVLFEILVALYYYENKYKVTFIKESNKKSPDLLITKNGKEEYVECKKMQRGNRYSYEEVDNWYIIANKIAYIIYKYNISGYFHFNFLDELKSINHKKVIRKIYKKINLCKNINKSCHIIKNKDFKIKFMPISSSKFNTELDPLRNIGGPSFIYYLIDQYKYSYMYKVLCKCEIENGVFASNVKWASILSYQVNSKKSILNKSQHIIRLLNDAQQQIPDNASGKIHILIEEPLGKDVYRERLNKNRTKTENFSIKNKTIENIYIHYIKYITPLNELFDVEETTENFLIPYYSKDYNYPRVWYPAEKEYDGFGSLFDDYK